MKKLFSEWTSLIKSAHIKEINGYIIGDDRLFEEEMAENATWAYSDLGTYYGTGACGLNFYENIQDFRVTAATHTDCPPTIVPSFPNTPWMNFSYQTSTGKVGSGNSLYYYTTDLAPVGEIRGSYPMGRGPKTEKFSNKFPAYTCAHYFRDYLVANGVKVSKGASDMSSVFPCEGADIIESDSLEILGSTFSPELKWIIHECNHESNNFYAEALIKIMGKEYCERACYDSAYVALQSVIGEILIDYDDKIKIADGSGLSRENYISADFMCKFLKGMMYSPSFPEYIESLASPGDAGTLRYIMGRVPYEIRSRIKMKSGSLGGVRCFSGYIIPSEGCMEDTIIFSILINNFTAKPSQIQGAIDAVILGLAKEN